MLPNPRRRQIGGPIAVLAGNYFEFENWREENPKDGDRAVFMGRVEDAHGREFAQVAVYGTFYQRKDVGEILEAVRVTPPKENK